MSAFLGPIHEKMYGRVLYQDVMANALIQLAEEKGWCDALDKMSDIPAAAPTQELEAIIDPSNIHGWLSVAVENCEMRFAAVVCSILDGHEDRIADVLDSMSVQGRKHSLPEGLSAEMAYNFIHDILLDGMPCDFPFVVSKADENEVLWQVAQCPHAPYWDKLNCNSEIYYMLRDSWVNGALEGSGIVHSRTGGSHSMRKTQQGELK